jgi:hypothetical protein
MSIGSVIKGIGSGVAKVGKTVGSELQEAIAPPVDSPSQVIIPPSPRADYTPMDLPEDNPNLPDGTPDPQYEEKKMIHGYVRQLEAAHQEYIKGQPDYNQQYQQLVDYVNSKPEPRRFSPLSLFAIGMGSKEGMKSAMDQNTKAETAHDKREQYLLDLKETAIKGNIQRLMEEGNFKKVLTESHALMDLNRAQKAADERRKQTSEIDQIKERNRGSLDVAEVRATTAMAQTNRRLEILAKEHKLTATQRAPIDAKYRLLTQSLRRTDPITGDVTVNGQALEALHNAWEDEYDALDSEGDTPATSTTGKTSPEAPSTNTPLVRKEGESTVNFEYRKMKAGQ